MGTLIIWTIGAILCLVVFYLIWRAIGVFLFQNKIEGRIDELTQAGFSPSHVIVCLQNINVKAWGHSIKKINSLIESNKVDQRLLQPSDDTYKWLARQLVDFLLHWTIQGLFIKFSFSHLDLPSYLNEQYERVERWLRTPEPATIPPRHSKSSSLVGARKSPKKAPF